MTKTAKGPIRNPQETMDRISELLNERRYNPGEFALALGFKRQWGYVFMRNQIVITLPLLMRISKLLGVSASSLLPKESGGKAVEFEDYVRHLVDDEMRKIEKKKK